MRIRYITKFRFKNLFQMFANSRLPELTTDTKMAGKTILISGATSGIGLAVAKRFAGENANLILIGRNTQKLEDLSSQLIEDFKIRCNYFVADYSNLEQVRKVAYEIAELPEEIDVVINNAGIFFTKKNTTESGLEMLFCVNHLSHFLMTYTLLPKLKAQGHGRVIFVNSEGHRFGMAVAEDMNFEHRRYTGFKGYASAKSAQLLTCWEFARRLEGFGVTVNAMHPGALRTNIGMTNGKFYNWYSEHILWKLLKDVNVGSDALHYLAAAPELASVTGKFFNRTRQEIPAAHALDMRLGKKIWDVSMKFAGLEETNDSTD
ncbi:MAG: SDR family NAD(P)-dependent oxidoreductase [Spirochaetales bacterium]|nr:SDR family NAD(P)-dependent oxidoreductase [Spirochaetales bacterium]